MNWKSNNMEKNCTKCKIKQDLNQFDFKNKAKNIRRSQCKECTKKYRKKYYLENHNEAKEYSYHSNKKIKNRNRKFLYEYLTGKKCMDCPEDDILVLTFDHKDRKEKKYNIAKIISSSYSLKIIIEEISKCEIRCANCHMRKTAIENRIFKAIQLSKTNK